MRSHGQYLYMGLTLGLSFMTNLSFAAAGDAEKLIQQSNAQNAVLMQKLQEKTDKQFKDLNTKTQLQLKQITDDMNKQIKTANDQNVAALKQVQDSLQTQIKQVQAECAKNAVKAGS